MSQSPYWIQTFSGKAFDYKFPEVSAVDPVDLAHSLAHQCRYAGHCKRHYSVAEHSYWVSIIAGIIARAQGLSEYQVQQEEKRGLVHDTTEAFLVDVPSPAKGMHELHGYNIVESELGDWLAYRIFFIGSLNSPIVKEADMIMLYTEKSQLLEPSQRTWQGESYPNFGTFTGRLGTWFFWVSKYRWLNRYNKLFGRKPASLKERFLCWLAS